MNEDEAQKVSRCRVYYETTFQNALNKHEPEPLDTVLHAYLNGSPSASAFSQQDRAVGLATANFWQNLPSMADSPLLRFAFNQVLRFDQAIPLSFIDLVITRNPDLMRWAIRYSQLFENPDSIVYKHLRAKYATEDWLEFFAVCDRLLVQLEPYKAAV
ncbi:hypothetical protein [Rheinheimera sp.]|uniref:hypothetical protein n=1 Tax=Rheinheimera sp. TaxID=1869214 RepID=UPI0040475927